MGTYWFITEVCRAWPVDNKETERTVWRERTNRYRDTNFPEREFEVCSGCNGGRARARPVFAAFAYPATRIASQKMALHIEELIVGNGIRVHRPLRIEVGQTRFRKMYIFKRLRIKVARFSRF